MEDPESPQRPWWVYWPGIALIVALRTFGLRRFPDIAPDEGGWPLSVRQWVETGKPALDYYMAPGYHWLLGTAFRLFGSSHEVGRATSVLVSFLSLWLFYRLARRLDGSRTAWWAVLLLGVCYTAILIDRRALIEPFQLALMLGLALAAAAANGPIWRYGLVAGLAAGLLLTKASAAFLLPALMLGVLWPLPNSSDQWRRAGSLALALGGGVLAAGCVFWMLYRSDPASFAAAWGADMRQSSGSGDTGRQLGRFALDPKAMEKTLRWYGEQEALLFGLAMLGLVKAVWERRQTLMAAWLAGGIGFLFIQLYIQENHRVLVLPAMAFLAAWLLRSLARQAPLGRAGWTGAAVALVAAYSAARVTGGIATAPPVETGGAVAWLATRGGAGSTVIAAPYVLMRLRATPVSFFALGKPYLPDPEALTRRRADWIVVDGKEWEAAMAKAGVDRAAQLEALKACCELAYAEPGASVYRVRRSIDSALRPGISRGVSQPPASSDR